MPLNGKPLGFLLAFVATALWASFYIVSRFAFGGIDAGLDPVWMSFLRYLMASSALVLVCLFAGRGRALLNALKEDAAAFALLGLLGIALQGLLVFWALKYTTAARCSLFANLSPVFTVAIAFFALREGLGWRKLAGMSLGFAGAAIATFGQGGSDMYFSGSAFPGDMMALASGVFWAAYTVFGRRIVFKHGGLVSATLSMCMGAATLLAFTVLSGRSLSFDISPRLWLATAYLGLFGGAFAFFCWFAALKRLSAGETGAFGYLSVAITPLLSFLTLKESFSASFWVSMAAIVSGVLLMMERPAQDSAELPLEPERN